MSKALSLGNTKEAALYFDRVFADDFLPNIARILNPKRISNAIPYNEEDHPRLIFKELAGLPASATSSTDEFGRYFSLRAGTLYSIVAREAKIPNELLKDIYEITRQVNIKSGYAFPQFNDLEELKNYDKRANREIFQIIEDLGFNDADRWVHEAFIERGRITNPEGNDGFEVSIRNLNLVDLEKVSWEQILEFRKDDDSRIALRHLRIFFAEELQGQEPQFIEDRLLTLQDDYERASKLWGFETTVKALSAVFENRAALAAGAGGIIAAASGAPLAAATVGAIPLGQFALEISKATVGAAKTRTTSPMSYLTRLKTL